jgi:tRNA A-37 threonylcarbamoyl transferase component Bud32
MQSKVSPGGKSTLLMALIAGLMLVAAVPFALVAFQTSQANEALIDQAQRAHLIFAKATAERVRFRLAVLEQALDALAANPTVFQDPNSATAQEAIAGALLGRGEILAVASFFDAENQPNQLVKMARRPDFAWLDQASLAAASTQFAVVQLQAGVVTLSRSTPRAGLRVAAAIALEVLARDLAPRELGATAKIGLRQRSAQNGAAVVDLGQPMPESMARFAASSALSSGATRLNEHGETQVGAFAQVADSPWAVLTLQPAEEAESARAVMRRSAMLAALVVTALVALMSLLAWRFLLQPIRQLFQMQRRVLGFKAGSDDSDLAQLRESFRQLEAFERINQARNQILDSAVPGALDASSPVRAPEPLPRVFLDRYEIVSSLGQGAMGSVFRAWDPRLCREVAIKTVRLSGVDEQTRQQFTRMLQNEAIAVAKLHHANVVVVHDCLVKDEFAFVVMEFVEGENLRSFLARLGALQEDECRALAVAILRALSTAHTAGFLHRDVKPANVLLSIHAAIKLGDFGIAARRSDAMDGAENTDIGTEGYIAPECQNGASSSVASDLYALGIVLIEAISNATMTVPMQKLPQWREKVLGGLDLTPELTHLLRRLTETNPNARPATADFALQLVSTAGLDRAFHRIAQRVHVSSVKFGNGPATKRSMAYTK